MRLFTPCFILACLLVVGAFAQESQPLMLVVKPGVLLDAKERYARQEQQVQHTVARLVDRAEVALRQAPLSVMDKDGTPPSGNKHDFMCPAPLWWPDPEQENGLPYVWNREGKINPEYHEIGDQRAFEQMARAVQTLSLAYFFTSELRYADHAVRLVRAWFLDQNTKMNPRLDHAWFERGRNDGTPFGIKSMERLPFVLDAIGMISRSEAWTASDRQAMHDWVAAYLDWLTTSELGRDAAMIWNRFGTVYDIQVVTCALFLGKEESARRVIEAAKEERINRHIRRDGRQPYALEREITFMNSVEGAGYFFQLATLAEKLDIDLWNYHACDGGSIRAALDFIAPYADSSRTWPYILEVRRGLLRPVLQQAAVAYDDDAYLRLLDKLPEESDESDLAYAFYTAGREDQALSGEPRLFVFDLATLEDARRRIAAGDRAFDQALRIVREEADQALSVPAASVMDKGMLPPSGDKHDFMSIGGYYWPDTTKPDGLPWIYRDGKANPDRYELGDWDRFFAMNTAVFKLGVAYFMTDEEKYAQHASHLLRVWFLDPATKMNPHLRYSHAQPGVMEGSYYGIIQTRMMPELIDAIGMLAGSRSWRDDDQRGMVDWCVRFLDWMLNDEEAQEAGRVWNNHSTNYDVTAVSFALFAGKRGTARHILEECKTERIARQIRPDGRLPFELERNRAWIYTVATLDKFVRLASMGDQVGIDLWHYESANGSSIKKAIDFLAFYADPSHAWPFADLDFQDSGAKTLARFKPILLRAMRVYNESGYQKLLRKSPQDEGLIRRQDLVYLFY